MPERRQESNGTRLLESARAFLTYLSDEVELCQAGESTSITSDELQALDGLICDGFKTVRRMINITRPINQLPPEILALIFSLVPDDLVATKLGPVWRRFSSYRTMDVRELCPLTEVCRHWRTVALSTSSLWSSTYDQTSSNGIVTRALHDNYVDRCTGGPLYVCIEGPVADTTVSLLRTHGDRVREVHMDGFTRRYPDDNERLRALIHTLRLENIEQCTLSYISGEGILAELFGGKCNKLGKLRLDNMFMFPSSPIPSLTHLAIIMPPQLPNLLGSLFNFLDGCPALTELYLYEFAAFSPATDVFEWRGGSVRLDNLERFLLREPRYQSGVLPGSLDAAHNFIKNFLIHLIIPASCIVRVSDLLASWLQPCLQLLTGVARDPASHMYIHAHHLLELEKSIVYNIRAVNVPQRQYTSVDVAVFRRQPIPQQELLDPLQHAITQLSFLSHIKELYVYSEEGASWGGRELSIFPALPHLETLVVELHHPTCARYFLSPLSARRLHNHPAPRTIHCPQLKTIVLTQLSSQKDAAYMRALAKARADAGYPLTRLLLDIRHGQKNTAEMSEYDAQGQLMRFYTQERADEYRLSRKVAEIAPESCPTWMEEEINIPDRYTVR